MATSGSDNEDAQIWGTRCMAGGGGGSISGAEQLMAAEQRHHREHGVVPSTFDDIPAATIPTLEHPAPA
ncbi:hypothetical protein KSP40_PGU004315 [Platanthera guangdongensis]|uniref:Uncharacterized protein n=1 Tax=Platanthera guangdongensis TaxID=2320717 RepID=A0ABR2MVJ7_9ASPA